MNNSLIVSAPVNTIAALKSDRLRELSNDIYTELKDVEENEKAICIALGKVLTEKAYEADGYKSVSDYANKVFGFDKSKSYALARAGARWYSAPDDSKRKALSDGITRTAMNELNTLSDEEIDALIEDGTIHDGMTAQDARKAAKAVQDAKPQSGKIKTMYSYDWIITADAVTFETTFKDGDTTVDVPEHMKAVRKDGSTAIMALLLADMPVEHLPTAIRTHEPWLYYDETETAQYDMTVYPLIKASKTADNALYVIDCVPHVTAPRPAHMLICRGTKHVKAAHPSKRDITSMLKDLTPDQLLAALAAAGIEIPAK